METRRGKLSSAARAEAVDRYANGEGLNLLAREYGVSGQALIRHIERRGITKHGPFRLPVNHHAFDILTDDAAYWIGFLMADGCVIKNQIIVQLSVADRAHIVRFKTWLRSSHAITDIPPAAHWRAAGQARFAFCSDRIVNILRTYGVVERKSLIATPSPIITENRAFWRGMIDGDGCFGIWGIKRPQLRLNLTGSVACAIAFQRVCRNITGRNGSVHIGKNNLAAYWLADKAARLMLHHLYDGATIALARKITLFHELLAQ